MLQARPFAKIVDLEQVLRGHPLPWFVSGGWAIDLFLGHETREHHDIEVGAFLAHQDALRHHLSAWQLARIRDDAWEPWEAGDRIALPEFQAQARSDELAPHVFDIFFNPLDGPDWVSRRHPDLRRPADEIFERTTARGDEPPGIPYLVPEIQILYKAKYHRPKDDADFDAVDHHLSPRRRRWLRDALLIHHAGDPWIERL